MSTTAVVLCSGNGSNLQAIIDAVNLRSLNLSIAAVVSNRSNAYALTRAAHAGVPTVVFTLKSFKDQGKTREDYDLALGQTVATYNPDIIICAGWMHILSPKFLNQFGDIIINLHPALPNRFDGANAIERAYAAFKEGRIKETGVMVHMVTEQVDKGRILITETVPIQNTDTLEDLVARMHEAEHRALINAIRAFNAAAS